VPHCSLAAPSKAQENLVMAMVTPVMAMAMAT
jgi:hypothetical protein